MSVRLVPHHPYGRHSRSVAGAAVDEVRRSLLLVLPEQPPLPVSVTRVMPERLRRREWRSLATAFGDLVEDVAGFAAVVLIVLFGLLTLGVLLWFAPWWLRVAFVVGLLLAGGVVWHWRSVTARVEDISAEIWSFEDGAL